MPNVDSTRAATRAVPRRHLRPRRLCARYASDRKVDILYLQPAGLCARHRAWHGGGDAEGGLEETTNVSETSRYKYPLKLPASLKETAARLAKDDGVSLNQWIAVAVAQKIGAVETAAEFFERRGARSTPGDLRRHLEGAPDVPPQPGDELPDA